MISVITDNNNMKYGCAGPHIIETTKASYNLQPFQIDSINLSSKTMRKSKIQKTVKKTNEKNKK